MYIGKAFISILYIDITLLRGLQGTTKFCRAEALFTPQTYWLSNAPGADKCSDKGV